MPSGGLDDDQITSRGPDPPERNFFGREWTFQAYSAKNSNPHIFKTMHRISIKFDRGRISPFPVA